MTVSIHSNIQPVSIEALTPHPRNEGIYGNESVEELAAKIAETNWIKPLVVSTRNLGFTILSGHRRYMAAKSLGIAEVPCELKECESETEELEILLLENQYREKTKAQAIREGLVWDEIEREKARERQGTRTDIVENLPQSEEGKSRDKIGDRIGMSGKSYETGKKVLETIDKLKEEGKEEDADLLEKVLNKSLSGAADLAPLIEGGRVSDETKSKLREEEITPRKAVSDSAPKQPSGSFHVSTKENDWYTPENFIDTIHKVMGSIDVDPASSKHANEIVKASTFYDKDSNGLDKEWVGNVFLNPPYSMPEIEQFVDKLELECSKGNINQAVILTNNSTDTYWCQKLFDLSSVVFIPKGRVKFYNPSSEIMATRQGQIFFYIGENIESFCSAFISNHQGQLMTNYDS